MNRIQCISATVAISSITIAACQMGGTGMNMPPPVSGPTPTSSGAPSEIDPNLHVTLPAQPAMDGGSTMPVNGPSQPAAGAMTGGAHAAMPAKPKPGAMGAMDAGAPPMGGMGGMGGMQDGGMKPGCCGGAPMPAPAPAAPPQPMPMKPHGGDM